MTDRSLQTAIAAMCIAMVSIVAASWTIHLVTPQQVAPQTSTLTR
jgi:hypothetical protein